MNGSSYNTMPLQFFERTDYHLHNVYRQILTELRVHKMFFRSLFLYLETRDMYDSCFMNSLWQYANRNETKKVVKMHFYFLRRAPNWLDELMFLFLQFVWILTNLYWLRKKLSDSLKILSCEVSVKVQIFLEGHKIWKNLPLVTE